MVLAEGCIQTTLPPLVSLAGLHPLFFGNASGLLVGLCGFPGSGLRRTTLTSDSVILYPRCLRVVGLVGSGLGPSTRDQGVEMRCR